MTRRKSRRAFEEARDLPAEAASGDKRDPHAGRERLGAVLLRQAESRAGDLRSSDLGDRGVAANADARGDAERENAPPRGRRQR